MAKVINRWVGYQKKKINGNRGDHKETRVLFRLQEKKASRLSAQKEKKRKKN